jgi:hypothetical protein
MAYKLVEEAVEARLRAQWTTCPIQLDNPEKRTTPADGAAYLVLQFPVADVSRWALNRKYYEERGGFRIVIHRPSGEGMATMRTWIETLSDIFRDERFGGITCHAPTHFIDDATPVGGYFLAAVVVPYQAHYAIG